MKKILLSIFVIVAPVAVYAGGLVNLTNQSVAYLRNMARGTSLSSDAVYYNPAGTAFMEDGFHIGLNYAMASQKRWTDSSYDLFALGVANQGNTEKSFVGNAFAPIVPTLHFVWKKKRWAVNFAAGIMGGGGTIKYNNGLSSLESIPATYAGALLQQTQTPMPYAFDSGLKATSMCYYAQIGLAFRITDWLSISAQVRGYFYNAKYNGYMHDITFGGVPASMLPIGLPDNIDLDFSRKGNGISPVFAIAVNKSGWQVNLKYELKASIKMKNKPAGDVVLLGNPLFLDGSHEDFPGLLTVAASKEWKVVKLSAEYHHYFDKKADNSITHALKGESNEYILGADFKLTDRWIISTGVQRAQHNLDVERYNDMNFEISSTSWGFGVQFKASKLVTLDAGAMFSFYDKATREKAVAAGSPYLLKDTFHRNSYTWGIGCEFNF